jgi:UDP-N-acetylglucosamine/UDP-N-acetyl-alpha-D-glucosaminouronate 4-epimerase
MLVASPAMPLDAARMIGWRAPAHDCPESARRVLFHCELVISAPYRRLREQLVSDPKVWVVTGVAGFIGSNLLQELLALGQTVVGVDNFSTGHRTNLDDVLTDRLEGIAHFRMLEGDIRELETCRTACEGADYVLHHAALGSVPWSMDDPLRTNAVNVDGFLNMLVAAKDAGVKRFVYASSSAVYGDTPDHPQIEDSLGRPLSPYAASKSSNETYALAFQTSYGLQSIGLRYFNVFGRRQDPSGAYAAVIPRWIVSLFRGERCRIFGDGETTRDFCYVANVVQANLLAATVQNAEASGEAYNVACGQSVTLNQLFHMMRARLADRDPRFSNAIPQYDPFRQGDIRFSSASIQKARGMLSFSPTHDVAEGLSEALDWYIERAWATIGRAVTPGPRHPSATTVNSIKNAAAPLTLATP